jgi:hypothetical protein
MVSEHIGQIDVRNVAFTLNANGRQNRAFRSLACLGQQCALPNSGVPVENEDSARALTCVSKKQPQYAYFVIAPK